MLVIIFLRLFRLPFGGFHREQRLLRRIADPDQRGGMSGLLDFFRYDDGHVLSGIMHFGVAEWKTLFVANPIRSLFFRRALELGHVQMRQHRQHSRNRLGGLRVDRDDFPFRDVAFDRPAMGTFWHLELHGIFCSSRDLEPSIDSVSRGSYGWRTHFG